MKPFIRITAMLFFFWGLSVISGSMNQTWAGEDLDFPARGEWFLMPETESRERWGGPDPTQTYRYDRHWIKVTHYGLKDSAYKTPEDYISWLEQILEKPKEVSEITVAGRKAKKLRFEYEHEGFMDHHGARIPHEHVYEEFVIVPAEEGFFSVVVSIVHTSPFFGYESPAGRPPKPSEAELKPLLERWERFLESGKINKNGARRKEELFALFQSLEKDLPLTVEKVEKVTGVSLKLFPQKWDPFFQQFSASDPKHPLFSSVSLWLPTPNSPDQGMRLSLQIQEDLCVSQSEILSRYGQNPEYQPSSGHRPGDLPYYRTYRNGAVRKSFGFSELERECLIEFVLDTTGE